MSHADNGADRLGVGEGRRIWAFGGLMILKLTAEQTSGRVFVMEQHVPRHRSAPGRRVHEVDDQSWFVIAGRGRWFIGDQTIAAGPGDVVHGASIGVDATESTHPPAALPKAPKDPDLVRRYGTTTFGPEPRWTPQHIRAS